MSLRPTCAFLSVSLLVSGCSLYRIRGKDQTPLTGIPFYPHVGVCRQETSYIQPVYRVAVQALAGTREVVLFEAAVTAAALTSAEWRDLRRAVVAENADPTRIGQAFEALTRPAAHQYDPQAAPTGLYVASNSLTGESQVDYGRPLFMNVSRPWIGSASASARLASDGTLAEASAEVKDATADTLLSALPVKDLLTALAEGDRFRALVGAVAPGTATALQLIVEPQPVKHTYTTLTPAPCPPVAAPIPSGAPGAMYRREQLASPTSDRPR